MIQTLLNNLVFQKLSMVGKFKENDPQYATTRFLTVDNAKRKVAYKVAQPETNDGTVVIYYHGNNTTIYDIGDTMALIANVLKSTVFYYDYPGYGLSDGQCTEKRVKADALEVFEFVKHNYTLKNSPERIILFGRSLGSGPATYAASVHTGIRALILLSPLTSVLHTKLPPTVLDYYDMFKNENYMPYISAPVLLFHGLNDRVVPYSHSKKLFSLSKNPFSEVYLIKNGDHNNLVHEAFFTKVLPIVLHFLLKR